MTNMNTLVFTNYSAVFNFRNPGDLLDHHPPAAYRQLSIVQAGLILRWVH